MKNGRHNAGLVVLPAPSWISSERRRPGVVWAQVLALAFLTACDGGVGGARDVPIDQAEADASGGLCPEGRHLAGCGRAGECVACLDDSDCGEGAVCDLRGECVAACHGETSDCSVLEECHEGHCRRSCWDPFGCGRMATCDLVGAACVEQRCGRAGTCPDGWSPVAGSLACTVDSCRTLGALDGQCGLEGHCVECNVTADCDNTLCDSYGGCTIDDTGHCHGDSQCPRNGFCEEELCRYPCTTHADCLPGEKCNEHGRCTRERCRADGTCPDGWTPAAGSLACDFVP